MTSLVDVVEDGMRTLAARIHTCLPARVVVYEPITNTIEAELAVKSPFFRGDGERDYDTFPVIPAVPVVWPRGGGYVMTLPLQPGDFVWLMFSEASLAEWRTTGQVSEPTDARRHSIGYPYAIPGAFPDVSPLSPEPTQDIPNRTTKMVIGADGGNAQIVIDKNPLAPMIQIGRDASDFVALATLVQTALDAIRTWANTHAHTGVTTGVGTSGAPATPLAAVGPVAATATKAK